MTVSPWTVLFEITGAVEVDTLDLPPMVSVDAVALPTEPRVLTS